MGRYRNDPLIGAVKERSAELTQQKKGRFKGGWGGLGGEGKI